MARTRQTTPAGHGEVLTAPDYQEWAAAAAENRSAAEGWSFEVAGIPIGQLRRDARREGIENARRFSERMGAPVADVADEPELLVATGHQPELYHPGVWIKDFLLQRLSEETGAAALDLVVDTDGFDTLGMHSPCFRPEVRVCNAYLAVGREGGWYGAAPVPDPVAIDDFCAAGTEHLSSLPAPALRNHFARFCGTVGAAASDAGNLAELITFARRRYEAIAGSDYLELPVSTMAGSRAFAAFVADMACQPERFVEAYNDSLAAYRERTGARGTAQPFPDLEREAGTVELPLWHLSAGGRRPVRARIEGDAALVLHDGTTIELGNGSEATDRLADVGVRLAPKALALTMFTRVFLCDFFIHGVGGGRYDQVTDSVIERYYGIRAPRFAVASMTMYLPLGARVVSDEELEALYMSLNRLRHNPDQMLDDVDFDTLAERERASSLAAEKAELVSAISAPDADKKSLGRRIRDVNEELAAVLAPVEEDMRRELERLLQLQEASGILTDRTYPFCLWDPREVADKAR